MNTKGENISEEYTKTVAADFVYIYIYCIILLAYCSTTESKKQNNKTLNSTLFLLFLY